MAKCAREECGKTVYPIEELKCLDKIWHKGCFKCTSCGMTLNMKTYKGYDKMPYCDSHYPKPMPSVVTDSLEMSRIAENTKYQSQVKYHEEYEKMKGTKTNIADDPEIKRHMENTKIQSQAQYHGEIEKKKQQDSTRPTQELTSNIAPSAEPDQKVGSIADYDPMNNTSAAAEPVAQQQAKVGGAKTVGGAAKTAQAQPAGQAKAAADKGFTVRALYDYSAADKDEVSFQENDVIVNCQKVDDGWMTGTVQRTLVWGMLPANYVEKVNQPTGMFKLT